MDIHTYVKAKLLLSPRQSRGFTCFNYAYSPDETDIRIVSDN